MATLGDLITYVKDFTANMADGKADRLAVNMVNDALRKVRVAHAWSRYVKRGRINLEQAVSGDDVSVALNGTTLTFASGETATQTYVDDEWEIVLDADAQVSFTISAIAGGGATATLTSAWPNAAVTSGGYTWFKSLYDLPTRCYRVYNAYLNRSQVRLVYLPEHQFDVFKQDTLETRSDPTHFTVRGARQIEVWPPLDTTTTRQVLFVTYEQYLDTYTTASSSASVIDWYAEWDDLLHRALDVEIAANLPETSALSFDTALVRYMDLLATYKGHSNGEVVPQRTCMTLGAPPVPYGAEPSDWALRHGGITRGTEV